MRVSRPRNFLPSATIYDGDITLHKRWSLYLHRKVLLTFAKKFLIVGIEKLS